MAAFETDKFANESTLVDALHGHLREGYSASSISQTAQKWVENIRATPVKNADIEKFFQHYGLSSNEGLALMTLAEALLRIPDTLTMDMFIRDRLEAANWQDNEIKDHLFRLSGMGLQISKTVMNSLFSKLAGPMIRQAMLGAMKLLGQHFVLGQTIEEAMRRADKIYMRHGYTMSYDMLGEGARSEVMAQKYFADYHHAVNTIPAGHGLSVKLTALSPHYDAFHSEGALPIIYDRLLRLCVIAKTRNIAITIDAEESERLSLSLMLLERLMQSRELAGWDKLGLAVQAYQKRAYGFIDHVLSLSKTHNMRLMIRLVKGAYWDTEIKQAQILGLEDFPVFTRKVNTDLCYLACAKRLMAARGECYPLFATHNAHTLAAIIDLADGRFDDFECQRLHGMGDALYDYVMKNSDVRASVYAPVGNHKTLLPYLVRRLLENGANSSFVNQFRDPDIDPAILVTDPVALAVGHETRMHGGIQWPRDLYAPNRMNSAGLDLSEKSVLDGIVKDLLICREEQDIQVSNIGVDQAFYEIAPYWDVSIDVRCAAINALADLMEENMVPLMAVIMDEGGRTIMDAHDEIREAVDFCRYYVAQAQDFFAPQILPGPTGEDNIYTRNARGIFTCISPWNFPLAIFTGPIVAALICGNSVIAKPAEQTPKVAEMMADIAYRAGVPRDVFKIVQGDGGVGAQIIAHEKVAGVAFTGSHETALKINRGLAAKDAAIVPLIAETGGLNAMVADSTALIETLVDDVVKSAFGSAGQRCSACRILCVQDDIADEAIAMLKGAMEVFVVGDPFDPESDCGPVIDAEAQEKLLHHINKLQGVASEIHSVHIDTNLAKRGHYFAPSAWEIDDLSVLREEVFGPILHVYRYKNKNLDDVIAQLNARGYGLTFGLHSRARSRQDLVSDTADMGNIYINKQMTGAVVGTQPFGGQGLSGTGPKAGGPLYLSRFVHEKLVSNNIAAAGGNASLMNMKG